MNGVRWQRRGRPRHRLGAYLPRHTCPQGRRHRGERRGWSAISGLVAGVLAALFTLSVARAQLCSSDADCDDGIACTIDDCALQLFFGLCHHRLDGVACQIDAQYSTGASSCNASNTSERSCVFSVSGATSATFAGIASRFGWGLCANPDATHDRSIDGTAQHKIDFDVTTPGGYRLDVHHSWKGLMRADSGVPFAGTSDGDVSDATAFWDGHGAAVPRPTPVLGNLKIVPGLSDPGHAHAGAGSLEDNSDQINGDATFSIYDVSNGAARSHELTFQWTGHARGDNAYGSVRMGDGFWDSSVDTNGECDYPGSPSRSQSSDGHFVDVTVAPLCGNGQIDAEVGEQCDPTDPNDPTCCTENCTLCCGDGVVSPGEGCDPAAPGATCPLICDAFTFTGPDWQSARMSLVNGASWADDDVALFDPIDRRLRVTYNGVGQRGSAWYKTNRVDPSRDWSTNFSFQLSFENGGGADGLALMLQRQGVSADLEPGLDDPLAINPYLSIGVDTFLNQGKDAFDESLEVHVNGTFPGPIGSATQGLSLANSNFSGCAANLQDCIYTLYAQYTASTHHLVVTVTSPNHSGSVSGTWNLDLAALLGGSGDFRVGFAARTGGSAENHDVLRWALQFQPLCGNGFVEMGEQCDAGDDNGTTASCCSATCTLNGNGTACVDDGNDCTIDTCNGTSAACTHAARTGACDDGMFCNGDDQCSGGTCSVHAGDPCPGPDGDPDCAESCNEAVRACNAPDPDGSSCDDGVFCDGADTCRAGNCAHAGNPCSGPDGDANCAESCDEATQTCTANDERGAPCSVCGVASACPGDAPNCPASGPTYATTLSADDFNRADGPLGSGWDRNPMAIVDQKACGAKGALRTDSVSASRLRVSLDFVLDSTIEADGGYGLLAEDTVGTDYTLALIALGDGSFQPTIVVGQSLLQADPITLTAGATYVLQGLFEDGLITLQLDDLSGDAPTRLLTKSTKRSFGRFGIATSGPCVDDFLVEDLCGPAPSATQTATVTATGIATATDTATATPTTTATDTATTTTTATAILTATLSATLTATTTPTPTVTSSGAVTQTTTSTRTAPPASTATATLTPRHTPTITASATITTSASRATATHTTTVAANSPSTGTPTITPSTPPLGVVVDPSSVFGGSGHVRGTAPLACPDLCATCDGLIHVFDCGPESPPVCYDGTDVELGTCSKAVGFYDCLLTVPLQPMHVIYSTDGCFDPLLVGPSAPVQVTRLNPVPALSPAMLGVLVTTLAVVALIAMRRRFARRPLSTPLSGARRDDASCD